MKISDRRDVTRSHQVGKADQRTKLINRCFYNNQIFVETAILVPLGWRSPIRKQPVPCSIVIHPTLTGVHILTNSQWYRQITFE
jgi:hypothetical protein